MADPAYIVDGVLTDGEAWVGIAHASLSLPAATVTFTSTNDGQTGDFSQYMDLVIICYTRSDRSAVHSYLHLNENNREGARHTVMWMYTDGATVNKSVGGASTAVQTIGYVMGASAGANEFSCTVTHLFDINSGKNKSGMSVSAADSEGAGETLINAINWRVEQPGVGAAARTSAIFEIDLTTYSDDFVAGSTFDLFGVLPRMVA